VKKVFTALHPNMPETLLRRLFCKPTELSLDQLNIPATVLSGDKPAN
jgi:hypothetical protein